MSDDIYNLLDDNKYRTWYINIIENALKQSRSKKDAYFETHHIIPKGFGGSNSKKNLVLLTAKEHFICHLLLIKCSGKFIYSATASLSKMLSSSINHKRYTPTSRFYELSRNYQKQFNPMHVSSIRKKHSESVKTPEYRALLSRRMKETSPKGTNHYKNKGLWCYKDKEFDSAKKLADYLNLPSSTIKNYCNKCDTLVFNKTGVRNSSFLTESDIGKTPRDIGFFIKKA